VNSTLDIPAISAPRLSRDAILVLGIAGTSMPFADSTEAELERWLRLLRLRGRAGGVLQALGVGESPLRAPGPPATRRHFRRPDKHVVERVCTAAFDSASVRGAETVETADILAAVLKVYGRDFEEVLEAHGTTGGEVLERLAVAQTVHR
jgi:hypothetical protein